MPLQDNFVGKDRKLAACEVITLTKLPEELRSKESALFHAKWFDYRALHPLVATSYFAHCYVNAVKGSYRVTQDVHGAESLTIFAGDPVLSRELMALTRARQGFDALGLRYEWALPWVMNRFAERGWRMAPRPNQLYSEELLLDLKDAWETECKASLQVPRSDTAPVVLEKPSVVQKMYESWVFGQVKARAVPGMEWMILHGLLSRRLVTHKGVEKEFGQAVLRRAGASI